jgi:uncharacterized protein (DUF433 family)
LQEAADYLQLPASTLRGWARPSGRQAALVTVFEPTGHEATMPFVGFAEAFVFTTLRRARVKERRIREGVEAVRRDYGVEYALASRLLWTDQSELLTGSEGSDLTVARTGQAQLTEFVRDRLTPIVYADDGYAARIRLPQFELTEVVVDPTIAFGYPLIEPAGARVKDIVSRFWAGDSMEDLSLDYGVPLASVEEVIRAQTSPPRGLPAS